MQTRHTHAGVCVCVCVLVCVFATWTCINTEKRRANNMWSVFVPVAGNWRVFIRLMDMKRKGKKGMKMEGGGQEEVRRGGWEGHWIIPQQILYNGPTSHIAACNFLATTIERGILQLRRPALITLNLLHMSAPVENEWAVAFSRCCCSLLLQLGWMDSASLGSLVHQHTHRDDKA